ncbi:MAG: phosphatidylserine decarboxylase [Proteobacteria bacterium]|nr:phosphatidylserine decarboxylase [Pseudomonadota bacterium]
MNEFLKNIPPIHPEGRRFVLMFGGATLLFFLLSPILGWIGVVLTLWCGYFFRDPGRVTPEREGLVIAPADGVICALEKLPWPEQLKKKGPAVWRVSIFMNVFNVHINRIPIAGKITRLAYLRGKFFNASLDKASEDNERQLVAMKAVRGGEIAFVQIAGLIARRIVCYLDEGQTVTPGERFGLIRFGSRVDVYLPKGVEPLVEIGQTTIAGETVLADSRAGEPRRPGSRS